MSDNTSRRPESDPVNYEAENWAAAGLPEQEDATEDTVLPGQEPVPLGEEGVGGTEREAGEPHDAALARERPDVGQEAAGGSEHDTGEREEPEPGTDPRGEERPDVAEGPGIEGAAVSDTSETGTLGGAPDRSVEQDGEVGDGPAEGVTSHSARLVEPDEGTHPDREKDLVARESERDGDAFGAEEAAVRVTSERETDDEPPP